MCLLSAFTSITSNEAQQHAFTNNAASLRGCEQSSHQMQIGEKNRLITQGK